MTEIACPMCKISTYLNPNIKIYISPCYHILCESCLFRLFTNIQAPCPGCGTILRKINYISQTFEDMAVERECKIRKQLMRYYFKEEQDFETTLEYNDYLEDFENIVFELLEMQENEMQVRLLEIRKQYLEPKKQKQNIITQEIVKKQKIEIFDPLADLNISHMYVLKKHTIPSCFKKNCLATGFSENIMIYRAYHSLTDENI